MPVPEETLTVELKGQPYAFPTLGFPDRRDRIVKAKTWLLVRAIENVLYGIQDRGRSTGAFANRRASSEELRQTDRCARHSAGCTVPSHCAVTTQGTKMKPG